MKISNIRSHYEVILYYGNAELYGKIINCYDTFQTLSWYILFNAWYSCYICSNFLSIYLKLRITTFKRFVIHTIEIMVLKANKLKKGYKMM